MDLDGTLTPSDTLYESVMLFIRRNPLNLLRLFVWLLLGKAGFKLKLANAVRPDPARLPYHERFVQFLREERARRTGEADDGISLLLAIVSGGDPGLINQAIQYLASTSYDRSLEREADNKAVDYLLNAAIDPLGFARFLEKIAEREFKNLQDFLLSLLRAYTM